MTDEKKQFGVPFVPGRPKTGGRARGTRNKPNADFIAALCEAFEEHGKEAIRIVVAEEPATFIKICASILPKEFEITDSRLKELPDDQLDQLIIVAQRFIGNGLNRDIESREDG